MAEPLKSNVEPVKGLSPAEVAKELRVLIKQQYEGSQPNPAQKSGQANTDKYTSIVAAHQAAATDTLTRAAEELTTLIEISKRRKPRETKDQVAKIAHTLLLTKNHLVNERRYRDRQLDRAEQKSVVTVPTVTTHEVLRRMYALVQALPVNEHSPNGLEETTIRAMQAILKVYNGVDALAPFSSVEMPDLPIILVHEVERSHVQEAQTVEVPNPF